MDVFLAPLSLIFSHHATAWLLQIMNRLAQKYIHSGFTFVIKQPLKQRQRIKNSILPSQRVFNKNLCFLCPFESFVSLTSIIKNCVVSVDNYA